MRIFVTIIIFIFLFAIITLMRIEKREVKYILSDVDGKYYLVRDLPDKQKAANLLSRLKENMDKLITYLTENKSKYPDYAKYIDQLIERIKNVVINESSEDSVYTSYSVNKGEQIVFCLRSKYDLNKMHDINLIMYVALHEMSHVACPSFGHTAEFKKIFAFFANTAVDIGIYHKISFNSEPTEYCGLVINESII